MVAAAALVTHLRRSTNPIAEMVAMALGQGTLPSTLDEVADLIITRVNLAEMWSAYEDLVYEPRERIYRLFLHAETPLDRVSDLVQGLRQTFTDARVVAQPSAAPDYLAPGEVRLDSSAQSYVVDIPVGPMLDQARETRAREL